MNLSTGMPTALIPITITLSTLIIATYYDLKSREISEYVWVPALVFSSIFTYLVIRPNILVLIFSLIPAVILLLLMFLGMIGGADFLALLLISISTPYLNVIPISMLTLLLSALIPSSLVLYNFIINLTLCRNLMEGLKCSSTHKLSLIFLSRPMKVSKFLKSKFMYPLTIVKCSTNEFVVKCRTSFNIEEDFKEHIRDVMKCLELGYVSNDDYIWVTPALPHILFITIGYILALVIPEEIIYKVFNLLLMYFR